MTDKTRPTEDPRDQKTVIDQRAQQMDPASRHRVDVNESAKRSLKQPGQDQDDAQNQTPSSQGPTGDTENLEQSRWRQADQDQKAGSAPDPENLDDPKPETHGAVHQEKLSVRKAPSREG